MDKRHQLKHAIEDLLNSAHIKEIDDILKEPGIMGQEAIREEWEEAKDRLIRILELTGGIGDSQIP